MQHLPISLQQLIDIREDGNILARFQRKPLLNWKMELKKMNIMI